MKSLPTQPEKTLTMIEAFSLLRLRLHELLETICRELFVLICKWLDSGRNGKV